MRRVKMLYTCQVHHCTYLGVKLGLVCGFHKKVLICIMNLLIVSATEAEIAPFTEYMQTASLREGVSGGLLYTGVGMLNTAYELTKHLQSNRYDLVLQVGV